MKKTLSILLTAMLFCGTLSVYAEARPIYIVKKPSDGNDKKGRSMIILPEASVDGQVLTIDFTSSTTFEVSVMNASGVVVYIGAYSAQGAVITLPNLPAGEYELNIEDAAYLYSGEFAIE